MVVCLKSPSVFIRAGIVPRTSSCHGVLFPLLGWFLLVFVDDRKFLRVSFICNPELTLVVGSEQPSHPGAADMSQYPS